MRKFNVTFYFVNDNERQSQIVTANSYDEAEKIVVAMFNCPIEIDEIFDVFDTPLNNKHIYVDMPDGFTYAIPVMVVVEHRAKRVTQIFESGDNFYYSMIKNTLPYFERDDHNIKDWAKNNMNWSDVEKHAIRLEKKQEINYQDVWVNGEMTIK